MQPLAQIQFARVLALDEDVQPAEHTLDAEVCTIGRSPMCQIVVGRNVVSRLHAQIERAGPRYVLRDAGSANGTFVNGRRIAEPHVLKDRDVLGFGSPAGALRFADPDPTVVPAGRLRYDEQLMRFFLEQQPADLTPAQFRLLHHLYQHAGQVCTRESCAQAIWGRDYDPGLDADALDRTINSLRAKLRQLGPADLIETRRGLGYVLNL
jgi:DNA-binding response OmpR family regulator